jgi:transposase, IS5 family
MEKQEAGERNAVEGKFGEAKQRYGLGRVMTRLSVSSESVIHLIFLVTNLKKRLRDLLFKLLKALLFSQFRSRPAISSVTQ